MGAGAPRLGQDAEGLQRSGFASSRMDFGKGTSLQSNKSRMSFLSMNRIWLRWDACRRSPSQLRACFVISPSSDDDGVIDKALLVDLRIEDRVLQQHLDL